MKRPKQFPSTSYTELASVVCPGKFCKFDNQSQLPMDLSSIAGFPSTNEFRATIIMASSTSDHPPIIGGITPASSSPIYRISVIRADQHKSSGEPHFNTDETLIFKDTSDYSWQLYAVNQPKHYIAMQNDSGLDAVLDMYNLPAQDYGDISMLRTYGSRVDFSTG